jgi:hypothetical protein
VEVDELVSSSQLNVDMEEKVFQVGYLAPLLQEANISL